MILSLFSGCGGLDLGFEEAGFNTGLAFDIRPHSIASWNRNRPANSCGHVADIRKLTIAKMDTLYGSKFAPRGVIGGPPCQSFTRANHFRSDDDPRNKLVRKFFSIALKLHRQRSPLDFIVMENVRELETAMGGRLLGKEIKRLQKEGFQVHLLRLNALEFGVPQSRRRLFLVALNQSQFSPKGYAGPSPTAYVKTVRDAIGRLPEPIQFRHAQDFDEFPVHPNHWCMTPQSRRFFDGSLTPGDCSSRSFKTLAWDQPSIAVSYGHREVHVHPSGTRRLSVFEAMRLQGFPDWYALDGTLSAQVDQVSEAVPPPLAKAVADSVVDSMRETFNWKAAPRQARFSKSSNADVA